MTSAKSFRIFELLLLVTVTLTVPVPVRMSFMDRPDHPYGGLLYDVLKVA